MRLSSVKKTLNFPDVYHSPIHSWADSNPYRNSGSLSFILCLRARLFPLVMNFSPHFLFLSHDSLFPSIFTFYFYFWIRWVINQNIITHHLLIFLFILLLTAYSASYSLLAHLLTHLLTHLPSYLSLFLVILLTHTFQNI